MSKRQVNIDMPPILDVLERIICEPASADLSRAEVLHVLHQLKTVVEVAQEDPYAPMEFYRQLGAKTTVFLGRRICGEKIASDLLKTLKDV